MDIDRSGALGLPISHWKLRPHFLSPFHFNGFFERCVLIDSDFKKKKKCARGAPRAGSSGVTRAGRLILVIR
jgi:hypothetical protein